jgi:hypothetical protein
MTESLCVDTARAAKGHDPARDTTRIRSYRANPGLCPKPGDCLLDYRATTSRVECMVVPASSRRK